MSWKAIKGSAKHLKLVERYEKALKACGYTKDFVRAQIYAATKGQCWELQPFVEAAEERAKRKKEKSDED